jgi:hypothetical protein
LFVQVIWWLAVALESLLLIRGVLGKWASRHHIFYVYLLFIVSQSFVRFAAYRTSAHAYFYAYWITEFIGVLVGCGILFEIYKIGFAAYPGTARMARNVLFLIFILVFTKALVDTSNDPHSWLAASTMEVERNVRIVQAVAIAALASVFAVYAVPFGRNLRGIVLGYGFYVTVCIAQLKFGAVAGGKYQDYWLALGPVSYLFALMIWTAHLWSFQPQPAPVPAQRLEHDYQKVANATRRRLQEARGYLGKATL